MKFQWTAFTAAYRRLLLSIPILALTFIGLPVTSYSQKQSSKSRDAFQTSIAKSKEAIQLIEKTEIEAGFNVVEVMADILVGRLSGKLVKELAGEDGKLLLDAFKATGKISTGDVDKIIEGSASMINSILKIGFENADPELALKWASTGVKVAETIIDVGQSLYALHSLIELESRRRGAVKRLQSLQSKQVIAKEKGNGLGRNL